MFTIDVLIPYFIACLILAIAPGPDILFVLTQSALQGAKAGILVVLGLCTGLLFHTTAVAFGVAVIFKTSALAFSALKIVGAAYLLYLAWLSLKPAKKSNNDSSTQKEETPQQPQLKSWQLYRRGIFMNITNPKVSIFFLAFLPQFASPARGSLSLQMVFLGFLFIVSALMVFSTVAYAAGALGKWIARSPRAMTWLNRLAGFVFIGLAVKLLFTEQT